MELEPDRRGGQARSRRRSTCSKPWIRSCHINDLTNDAAGKYPYRELFRLLRGIGYDRYTICEVGKAYPDAEKGREFLKEYKKLWEKLSAA